jgi:hypothetical protein
MEEKLMPVELSNKELFERDLRCAQLDRAALFDGMYAEIPPVIQDRLMAYLESGHNPGSFLEGVLTNDLTKAVNSARGGTEYSHWYPHLQLLVLWVYNQCPSKFVNDGYATHVVK